MFVCDIYFCGYSHYPPVKSDSERHRYKADFTSEYSEYLRLHGSISQRMKTFSALSDKLKQAAPHSSEYEVKFSLFSTHMCTYSGSFFKFIYCHYC